MRLNSLILKKDPPEELSYAIRRILTGGFYVPASMSLIARDYTKHGSDVRAKAAC
jgi:DNA-binding NarL/FixJ family response regulator